MATNSQQSIATARTRLITAVIAGIFAGFCCAMAGKAKFAPLAAWDVTVFVFGFWLWLDVWPMNGQATKNHALSENPGRALADSILLLASIGSIGGVVLLIADASSSSGIAKTADILLGLLSVVLSWGLVHTIFMLKYARLYYGEPQGGISFNQNELPQYTDFGYLAFSLGMTFQVSDTNLQNKEIRKTAFKHSLLAYLFGTVIIATTINTLASLT